MSKFKALSDQLAGQAGNEWRTSFDEVDQLLGGALPKTARSGVAWWANDGAKAQAKTWMDKGWQVRDVDPKAGTVIFMKTEPAAPKRKAAAKPKAAGAAAAKPAAKPKVAAKPAPRKAAAPKSTPAPVIAEAAAPTTSVPETPAPDTSAEPAFLERLPGGNKTAVVGGIAAAVLGVGALIARAFLRKK